MKIKLGVILGLAFVFRLLFLGDRQLWTDELIQALAARSQTMADLFGRLSTGIVLSAPLDFLVQKGVVTVAGISNWTLRFHAAVFGTASVWLLFRIARLLFGTRVAVYCAVLFALFPLEYHFSQQGRPYALFLFLSLLAWDILLRILYRTASGWQAWGSLLFVLVLANYTSFLGITLALVQLACVVIAVLVNPGRLPGAAPEFNDAELEAQRADPVEIPQPAWADAVAYAVAAVIAYALFLPWVGFAWDVPLGGGRAPLLEPKLVLRLFKELGDNSYVFSAILLAGCVAGWRALRSHARARSAAWLLAWAGAGAVTVVAWDALLGYGFAVEHILHATPPLVLLAGYGLSYVGERLRILERLPYQISSPAIVYVVVFGISSGWIAQAHWKQELVDWRGAALWLETAARPGDSVSMPRIAPLLEYYAPELAAYAAADLDPGQGSLASPDVQRRFVVCHDGMTPDPCRAFAPAARKDKAWRRQQFRRIEIFFRAKAPQPAAANPAQAAIPPK